MQEGGLAKNGLSPLNVNNVNGKTTNITTMSWPVRRQDLYDLKF